VFYVIAAIRWMPDHDRMVRRVVIVAFPGVQSLDVTGPLEVFDGARRALAASAPQRPAYSVEVVAQTRGPFSSTSGLQLIAARTLAEVRGPVDTLLIAGGLGSQAAAQDPALISWLRRIAPRCRRVGSVCTGAFVLASAGLLDGRRATTHWSRCAQLAARFPKVKVEPDPIFVRDGKLWTSAGVTAGMDLALALVEADFGAEVALLVARHLVLFVRRPGGQSQFSAQMASQVARRVPLRELQSFIHEHVRDDLRVPRLAQRAGMSPRNFARAFVTEIGTTPAAYVERARVEVARQLLETSDLDLAAVAAAAGFGTAETLRRAFGRELRVTPGEYRSRFRPSPPTKESHHAHHTVAIRPHHRARRDRALRSAQPPARRTRAVRGTA
jgi:transcriptional regulator GlxA family with amidase domain